MTSSTKTYSAVDSSDKESSAETKSQYDILWNGLKSAFPIAYKGQLVTIFMMICIVNISYGPSWNSPPITRKNLHVGVWLGDGSLDGLVEQGVNFVVNHRLTLGLNYDFNYISGSDKSLEELQQDVNNGYLYGALILPKGVSNQLYGYLNGTSSHRPTCEYIYDQARLGATFQIPLGALGSTMIQFANQYISKRLVTMLWNNEITVTGSASKVVSPVYLQSFNLHEVDRYGLFVASGVGNIQYFLVMLVHTLGLAPLQASLEGHGIKRAHITELTVFHRIFGALYLSLFVMITILILGSGSRRIAHSVSTFFTAWAYLWLCMGVYGGIVYHTIHILGSAVAVVAIIIFLTFMNVGSAYTAPYAAVPLFYHLGTGFPFYNASRGLNFIWFSSQPNLFSQSIGILFVYVFCMTSIVQTETITSMSRFRRLLSKYHLFRDEHEVEAELRQVNLDSLSEKPQKETDMEQQPEAITADTPAATTGDAKDAKAVRELELMRVETKLSIFDPSVRPLLKAYIMRSLVFEIILACAFLVMMFVAFGSAWDPERYFSHVHIAILNADATSSSSLYSSALNTALNLPAVSEIGFHYSFVNTNDNDVREKVDDHKYFGALIIEQNSSAALNSWLHSATGSSAPSAPIRFVYDGARGGSYINGKLRQWATVISSAMNRIISSEVVNDNAACLSCVNADALISPARLDFDNLHPIPSNAPGADAAVAQAATAMYLALIAATMIINASQAPLEKLGIDYKIRVAIKAAHIVISSLLLSFWPVISILWYGLHLSGNQFFQMWALLWLSMCAYSSYMIMNQHLYGQGLGTLMNIVLFTLNSSTSTASLPLEVMPRFFHIGFGLPSAQAVVGSRYILFGSDLPGLRRAIGVLIAWCVIIFLLSISLFERKRDIELVKKTISYKLSSKRIDKGESNVISASSVKEESLPTAEMTEITSANTVNV
jgi:hypothetical protein